MALSTELLVGLKSMYGSTGSTAASSATSSGMFARVCAIAFTRSLNFTIACSRHDVQSGRAAPGAVHRDPGRVHILAVLFLRLVEDHLGVGQGKPDHLVDLVAPQRLVPLLAGGVLRADSALRRLA